VPTPPPTSGDGTTAVPILEKEIANMTSVVAKLDAGTWVIDPVHSSIIFSVRHLMVSTVRGRFGAFNGTIQVGPDNTTSVHAEVSIDSIDTGNEQRDGHLKSADFFDAAQYPLATFTSSEVRVGGDDYVLDGKLTIKGVTKPVTLSVQFHGVHPGVGNDEVAGIEAAVVINRKDFGIDIDLPLGSGGVVVGEKVTVSLAIEAVKQP
jgi:polyisoprenoid-binding protein YceI